jgi:hypothetical protein
MPPCRLDLPLRLTQHLCHRFEAMPEDAIPPGPTDRPLIQPLLPVRQIMLPTHDIRWIKAAGLVPGIECITDSHYATWSELAT